MTPAEFLAYLHAQVGIHGTQKTFARHCGIGEAFLSEVLRGTRAPGRTMLAALGFEKVVTYERRDKEKSMMSTTDFDFEHALAQAIQDAAQQVEFDKIGIRLDRFIRQVRAEHEEVPFKTQRHVRECVAGKMNGYIRQRGTPNFSVKL